MRRNVLPEQAHSAAQLDLRFSEHHHALSTFCLCICVTLFRVLSDVELHEAAGRRSAFSQH